MGEWSWVNARRDSLEYLKGVHQFIDFASAHGVIRNGKIKCPRVNVLIL